ncbi:unnamed protein product [Protopolystoma xenopodis]|uniref:Uncharacterized protein n=1 Tax=Protopolystoma xenopodis TaxID=117903 RepID=A0A448XJG0_9PLAT|nr:unnamed protein product [Protopolystoma xenopodis]
MKMSISEVPFIRPIDHFAADFYGGWIERIGTSAFVIGCNVFSTSFRDKTTSPNSDGSTPKVPNTKSGCRRFEAQFVGFSQA